MRSSEEIIADLREIQNAKIGDPLPRCMRPTPEAEYSNNWGKPLSKLCGEAADKLEYWQAVVDGAFI